MSKQQDIKDEQAAEVAYQKELAKDAKPPAADREEFARQHSDSAAKQAVAPPQAAKPDPAVEKVAKEAASVPVDELNAEIAASEQRLAALKARKASTEVREFPKVLYHADHAHETDPVAPVTVADKAAEDEARSHGWVHDNPSKAAKASQETPNAPQHTREDEHQRRDLPAQMAVDRDARTGKGPVDLTAHPDAADDADDKRKAKK